MDTDTGNQPSHSISTENGLTTKPLTPEVLLHHVHQVLRPLPIGHFPTPLENLPNLGRELGLSLMIKRDDATGIALGGNKVRQLRFYLAQAVKNSADTILITGAIQSNFVRTAAAMARSLSMDCHIQLENRVPDPDPLHRNNGNVLLDNLLGATIHSYSDGEDESGADSQLEKLATTLSAKGAKPYIVPLGEKHPPLGALGYIEAAVEIHEQLNLRTKNNTDKPVNQIVIASGSALTHVGLLFGLRALGSNIPVRGICVRRDSDSQRARVARRIKDLAALLKLPSPISHSDIVVDDCVLAPGYGQMNPAVEEAILLAARTEGVFVDPVYTGRTLAGLIAVARQNRLANQRIIFWHTGGQAALFAYADALTHNK